MNTLRSLALGATILAGIGALGAAPAMADRRSDAAAATTNGLNVGALTAAVRTAGGLVQTAMAATPPDLATAEAQLGAADAAARNDDDHYLVQQLRVQLEAAKFNAAPATGRNPAALSAAIDALASNPRTPATQQGTLVYTEAGFYYDAHRYAQALPLLLRARQLGVTNPDLNLQIAQSKLQTNDVAGGVADLQTAIAAERAAGRKPSENWYRIAINALMNAHMNDQLASWLRMWLVDYPAPANWHDSILIMGLQGPNAASLTSRQRLDLYRLMRATRSLTAQRDYLEYADAAANVGQVTEARAVIQQGRSSGAVPATDSTATAVLTRANAGIAALRPLAAQEAAARASGANGSTAMQVGDFYLGAGEYAKAADLYRLALQRGGVDAGQTNLHLGMALALAGNRAEAQAALALVPAGTPNAPIATLWTTYAATPAA